MPNYMTELSPDNNTHVYQIKDKEAAPIDLLKDTVGWVGKNLLDKTRFQPDAVGDETITQITNGIRVVSLAKTYKFVYVLLSNPKKNTDYIFSDNSVITSGYTLLRVDGSNDGANFTKIKESSGTSSSAEQSIEFNSGAYEYLQLRIFVTGGTAVAADISFTNIMLREASILDDTYEPYHPSVEQCKFDRAEQRVLGAKNLLDFYNLKSSDISVVSGASYTLSDTTYDISIPSSYESASGIYFKSSSLRPNLSDFVGIPGILTLLVKGSSAGTVKIGDDSSALTDITTSWQEISLPVSDISQIPNIIVYARSQTLLSGHIFIKDMMLRLASDPDSTYVPYAMTNRELTERIASGWSEPVGIDLSSSVLKDYGTMTYTENVGLKLACIKWEGNGTTPSSAVTDDNISIPLTKKPVIALYGPMRRGDQIGLGVNKKAVIRLTSGQAWSSGFIIAPTE